MSWRSMVGTGLIVGLSVVVCGLAEAAGEGLELTLRTDSLKFVRGASINLHIELRNASEKPMTVIGPLSVIHYSVKIQVTKGGLPVRPLVHCSSWPANSKVELLPGKSLETDYDLMRLYHIVGLEEGVYEIRAVYQPSKEWQVISNAVTLEVRPAPKEEAAAFEAYLKLSRGAGEEGTAKLGREFLQKYPDSLFADNVRLQAASALRTLKQYDESAALYRQAADSKKAPRWMREDALGNLGLLLYKQGKKAEAMGVFKESGTPAARSWARQCERELQKEKEKEAKNLPEEKTPAEQKKEQEEKAKKPAEEKK